nr:hypothetical protein CFP56_07069 [Quercus suber]
MGNLLQMKRQVVEEDCKKLLKLILESNLALCSPGDEDSTCDLEVCQFCSVTIDPNSTRPTQCPFCETANYAVEYRGVKTEEEKCLEQIEEQRVIEAKIRMWQQEIQDEEERVLKRQELSFSLSLSL